MISCARAFTNSPVAVSTNLHALAGVDGEMPDLADSAFRLQQCCALRPGIGGNLRYRGGGNKGREEEKGSGRSGRGERGVWGEEGSRGKEDG